MCRKLANLFIIMTTLSWSCNVLSAPATQTDSATTPQAANTPPARVSTKDPFNGFNRAMYTFNDGLDHLILKPVAQLYVKVMPQPVIDGVHNFYNNLRYLPTIGNDVLQFDFRQTLTDTSYFLVNTTLGLLGIFDISKLAGIPQNSEDMGLTFARWGWTSSTYIVVPFFGPSTIRDGLGELLDYEISVYPYIKNISFRNQLYALGVVNTRANLLQLDGIISEAALDPYVFQRNAYLQHRSYLIKRNSELQEVHTRKTKQQEIAGLTADDVLPMTNKQVASY